MFDQDILDNHKYSKCTWMCQNLEKRIQFSIFTFSQWIVEEQWKGKAFLKGACIICRGYMNTRKYV
jgi:hypothetical protein